MPIGDSPVRDALIRQPEPPMRAVARPRLEALLEPTRGAPVTLLCAPAGFGKTVLASQWCETTRHRFAWLSLDRMTVDPRWLPTYLAAAIRRTFPEAMTDVARMVQATELLAIDAVTTQLSNDLDDLPEPLVIVLDDFHQLTSPPGQAIMAELLHHPAESVHYVILTRGEPSASIVPPRAGGQRIDLRAADLAYTRDELASFLEQNAGGVTVERLEELWRVTEGWPAGARLVAERERLTGDDPVIGAGYLDRAAQEYLFSEVLEQLPAAIVQHLLAVSRFDWFNASLCDAVAGVGTAEPRPATGAEFIAWLHRHDFFIVGVRGNREWLRFHHLFSDLLEAWRSTHESYGEGRESEMRRAAASVYRQHGLIEEATRQLVAAGLDSDVAALAVGHGNELIEREAWPELEVLLSSIPDSVLDREPGLLVLRGWLLGNVKLRELEASGVLERAEELLDNVEDSAESRFLLGQIHALRSVVRYTMGDFDEAIEESGTAIKLLAATPSRHLGFSYLLGALARVGSGRFADAHRFVVSTVGDDRFAETPFDPMATALPYIGWLEGDLNLTERHASQLLALGKKHGLQGAVGRAHYFLGVSAYERNRLVDAEVHLGELLDVRYLTVATFSVHAGMARALRALAMGRTDEADAIADATMKFVLETRSEYLLPVTEAFMAELDHRQGRHAAALRWAQRVDADTAGYQFMFYDPEPTIVDILLSSPPDAERGRQLLQRFLESAKQRNHRPLLMRLLALHALDLAAGGDDEGALEALGLAVGMSHDSGMIRRLADLGPRLDPLLHRLDVGGDRLAHVAAVLAAIESVVPAAATAGDRPAPPPRTGPSEVRGEPPLTPRELDVLTLLTARRSNKEIARELLIAPATVKKHTVALYDKLNVHGRREAVEKARALGYLPD